MNVREFGNELLTGLLDHATAAVPGALGAGLSLATKDDAEAVAPRSLAAVGVAAALDPPQWADGGSALWGAFRSGEVVLVPDHGGDDAGPSPAGAALFGVDDPDVPAEVAAVRGAVFSAGEWGEELPVVVSFYFDRPADDDAVRDVDRHEAVLTQALAVVEHCAGEESRAEQMVQMAQYRRVIEQAKGLVMAATGTDAATAFSTLSRASQHFNVRLRNLSVAVVELVGGAEAEHPDDPELVVRPSDADRAVAEKVWAALSTGPILTGGSGEASGRSATS